MPAISVHHTETQEGAWDGPRNVARLRSGESQAYYARMFAWRDPDGDPETKSAYKFPHHMVGGDGDPGAAVVRGCQSGIAVLNGSMGGADIPSGDRRGVYRHLAAHLEDADVEPAELRKEVVGSKEYGVGDVERRFLTPAEVRVVEDDEGVTHIRGYGAVFNQWSEDLGHFRELVEPGAFSKTLEEADVRSLWNHEPNYVLGRSGSGTLALFEDEHGLAYDATPPDTQWARDLMVSIRRGDVDASSFGFEVVRDKWGQDENGLVTRRLVEVKLFDVGPVTFPAYPQTSAEARAKVASMQEADAPRQEPHPEASQGDVDVSSLERLESLRRRLELSELETYLFGGDK